MNYILVLLALIGVIALLAAMFVAGVLAENLVMKKAMEEKTVVNLYGGKLARVVPLDEDK